MSPSFIHSPVMCDNCSRPGWLRYVCHSVKSCIARKGYINLSNPLAVLAASAGAAAAAPDVPMRSASAPQTARRSAPFKAPRQAPPYVREWGLSYYHPSHWHVLLHAQFDLDAKEGDSSSGSDSDQSSRRRRSPRGPDPAGDADLPAASLRNSCSSCSGCSQCACDGVQVRPQSNDSGDSATERLGGDLDQHVDVAPSDLPNPYLFAPDGRYSPISFTNGFR